MKKLPRFLSMALLAVGIGTLLATPPASYRVIPPSPSLGKVELKELPKGRSTVNDKRTARKISLKDASKAPKINGTVCSAQTWTGTDNIGVYSFVATSTGVKSEKIFSDADIKEPYAGTYCNGGYYIIEHNQITSSLLFSRIYCYDASTWEPQYIFNIGTTNEMYVGSYSGTISDIAIISRDGANYGITSFQSFLTPNEWGLIEIQKFPQTGSNYIKQSTDHYIGLTATPDNVVYAINDLGYFGTIDTTTGDFTKISETGLAATENCSATYSSKDGQIYFSYTDGNSGSSLYQIDPATGSATYLYDFPEGEVVVGLYIDEAHDDDVPAAAEQLKTNFTGSSLEGTLSFHIPAYLYNGQDAQGVVDYAVSVDGSQVIAGSDNYGSDVTCNVSVANNGTHTFEVVLSNAAGSSDAASIEAYVGLDTPLAPSAVELSYANGKFSISWQAVNKGVNGGFISDDDVRYTVRRDFDNKVVAENITGTSFEDAVAEKAGLETYTYSVTANLSELSGEATKSNAVTIGYIVPDYTENFDSDSSLNGYTIIDANEDGLTWYSEFGQIKVMATGTDPKDDWFITPSVMLEAGENYEFAFDASALLASYKYYEQYEVCIGTEPTAEGLSTVVQPTTTVSSYTSVRQVVSLKVNTTGRYYIGLHAVSAYPHATFLIDNFEIYKGSTDGAPAAVENFIATADPQGQLKATLSFTAPSLTKVGDPLSSITKVEISRDGTLIKTLDNIVPGQSYTTTDDNVNYTGTHTYAAVAYNEIGEGPKATAIVFVGFNTPSYPRWISIDEDENDPGMVTVSWQPVTTDIAGGTIPEGTVSYMLYVYDGTNYDCLGTEITETSFTHRAVEAGHQAYVNYYIYARNPGGIGDVASSEQKLVGTPHSVPFFESFPNGQQTTETFLTSSGWYLATDAMGMPASDGDNGYLLFFSNYQTSSALMTGKIDFSGTTNPGLIFACYDFRGTDGTLSQNTIDISITADGTENLLVRHTADGNNAWHYVVVPLSDYVNKTGLVNLTVSVVNCPYVVIDDLRVIDLYDYNLTASAIDAPAHAIAGESFDVTVKVQNNGMNAAKGYTVELYCNDQLIESKRGGYIESCHNGSVTFNVTANPTTEGDAKYYAKIVYDADLYNDDNTSPVASIDIDVNNYPAPLELKATDSNDGVALTWEEPVLTNLGTAPVTEDFEDYDSWVQDNFGNWTTIDADQLPNGGIQDSDGNVLNLASNYMAYCISDINTDGFEDLLIANSGIKAAMSMYVYDPTTYEQAQSDDWLITPELSGDAQKITFYASAVDYSYPESFEILISKTGTETSDFEVVKQVEGLTEEWTYYGITVPAGTKYLAIRCTSATGFLFFVDDITYIPADGAQLQLELKGYNIYRDGKKINSAIVSDRNYVDNKAAEGIHNYYVTAVYDKGESQLSNLAKVSSSISDVALAAINIAGGKGQITVSGANGQNIQVFTTDGRLKGNYAGAAINNIPATTGVYIVKIGAKVAKVVVE